MKGGFNNPPNQLQELQQAAVMHPSMKGGFNNPPNGSARVLRRAGTGPSMKGGFNNPPNTYSGYEQRPLCETFNEGGVQ